ncbi:hypothetical protein M408DRAFT_193398 [Serendipita vermifera MAFF 305830]|uniref:F-box domain-containing protein n=1 Tax=Serendipita vermifera MAFF 305830 TaxID=933852 RepID=A0A0C3B2N0_SERVB|nr:hypothetical protein M408DRAFT_193398 [Serendipita vermifera MAFF 305830]
MEIIIANIEARLHEAFLSNAEQTINELEEKLKRHKAWISPVRRIPIEILSIIFVEATRVEWKMPFILGSVCYMWRLSILETPQVWSMVNLSKVQSGSPLASIVERSAPFPFNLVINEDDKTHLTELIETHTGRIKYLRVRLAFFSIPKQLFSNLTALAILHHNGDTYKFDPRLLLDGNLFPNLRCLKSGSAFSEIDEDFVPPALVPPIEEIVLTARTPQVVTIILKRLAHRLVSIFMVSLIHIDSFPGHIPVNISFPRLHTLSILTHYMYQCLWPFDAQTPVLYGYNEAPARFGWGKFHRDTRTVKRLGLCQDIDLRNFPGIREVRTLNNGARVLLSFLEAEPDALPDLEMVSGKREGNIEERIQVFNRKYGRNITPDFPEKPVAFLTPPCLEWEKRV